MMALLVLERFGSYTKRFNFSHHVFKITRSGDTLFLWLHYNDAINNLINNHKTLYKNMQFNIESDLATCRRVLLNYSGTAQYPTSNGGTVDTITMSINLKP